jgi:thiol-disulfide isomerase/thioredoxin/outer membrane lipoprotein-sorting protein
MVLAGNKQRLAAHLYANAMVLVLAALVLVGCGDPNSTGSAAVEARPDGSGSGQGALTADEILARMIETYRAAETYRDSAIVGLDIKAPDGNRRQEFQIGISFARPNRVRITRDDLLVSSDGQQVYGKVLSLSDQVVVAPAPEKIVVPAFYSLQAISPLMQPGIEGHSIQLDLLAADQPLKELRRGDIKSQVLEPAVHDGRDCHRLSFRTEVGDIVFWIDKEKSILRRLEFPTDELKQSMGAGVDKVSMTAEFEEAQLDADIDPQTFLWKPSENETQVRYFVSPPDPRLAPNPLLGQLAADLMMTTSDGEQQELAELQGKVAVIDFWATWCGFCLEAMPKFGAASEKFRDSDEVKFLAVSLDTPDISDKVVAAKLRETGVKVPWARVDNKDPLQTTLETFGLRGIPACVVLDKQGRVQFLHEGADLEYDTRLPELVDAILAGKDLTRQSQQLWDELQKQYTEELQRARVEEVTDVIEIQRAEVAQRKEPQDFVLKKMWHNSELESPGNLLVATDAQNEPRVLVVDGLQAIVQLNAAGEIAARRGEQLPKQAAVSFVRTGKSDDGVPIYVAGGAGVAKFFVFDHEWKLLLEYPPEDTAQVYDVLPVDLDGDGALELCVGYFNEAGVHAITLDGQRLWRNRSVSSVSDLEATSVGEEGQVNLLCAHSFGTLDLIDDKGKSLAPIRLANRAVTHVAVADREAGEEQPIAAITIDPSGRRSLVGISRAGDLRWQYLLPPGEHENPLEMLVYAQLIADQPGYWLVASADGTLHIVSVDGQQSDRFRTGEKLSGFAAGRFDDRDVLLTSSDQGVTAYAVTQKE